MAAPGIQMDSETALELVKKGSMLLLLDVPQSTLVGIDARMFFVGPMFKGIKMIPPGPHFIYYSSPSKEGNEFSPMIGFFFTTNASEVIVRKWDKKEERLVEVPDDEEHRYCVAARNFEFDNQLGPYALDHYKEWQQLSDYITKTTIQRIEPIGGEISVEYESELFDKESATVMEKHLVQHLKHDNLPKDATERSHKGRCYYIDIPHFVRDKNISGEELTALNLDKTKLLETILMNDFGGSEDLLLGELQFSFVAFMMGQSLQAFLQWKALVSLLFSCTEAPLHTRSRLFLKSTRVIYYQLKHSFHKEQINRNTPDKGISLLLDDNWLSKETFLYRLCKEYFPLVLESQVVDGDLLAWTRKLKGLLETALGWDFVETPLDLIDEDDEFSPVVVLLSDASLHEG